MANETSIIVESPIFAGGEVVGELIESPGAHEARRKRAAGADACLCDGGYNPACPYPAETSGWLANGGAYEILPQAGKPPIYCAHCDGIIPYPGLQAANCDKRCESADAIRGTQAAIAAGALG